MAAVLDIPTLSEKTLSSLIKTITDGRVVVHNASGLPLGDTPAIDEPSFAFGQAFAKLQQRTRLTDAVRRVLDSGKAGRQLTTILSDWLRLRDGPLEDLAKALEFADQWLVREAAFNADIATLHAQLQLFAKPSLWVVMADGLGAAGASGSGTDLSAIHQALAAEEDVNVLVLVADPSLVGTGASEARPRRDVGLYAANYGTAYVAATSPLSHPEQFERSVREADAFHGPSVVVAYIPTPAQVTAAAPTAAAIAGEAVESGRWPLYRWDPVADARGDDGAFTVDSSKLRADVAAFLEGNNHLSLLARASPALAPELTQSHEWALSSAQDAVSAKLKASFDALMGAFTPPPLTVLFGSDGGNAETLAKRLANEAKTRFGFAQVTVKAMDAVASLEELAATGNAVFVVSTAGQGDMPSNARHFFKTLSAAAAAPGSEEGSALAALRFAVFGLGDSNYWPKKEQRIFYNKASLDLDVALRAAGAQALVDRGLGDDQDVGGYSAGWKRWLPPLWASLGVAVPDTKEDDAAGKVRGAEDVKVTSRYLRGTIAQGLTDTTTGQLTYEDTLLTKFHGIYQQDDRDLRGERKRAGLEPAYSFMVRVRIPGGVCTPQQYLVMDGIADSHANGTIRATTRQAVQFHGIIKGKLKPAIAAINRTLMDTLAACGDVNRNVMCNINPHESPLHAAALHFSKDLSDHLTPATTAYAEIWLDEKPVRGASSGDYEPIYGTKYLPRKFKIGVAVPPSNDVDIYTQDLSYIAMAGPNGELEGFNVTIGGGMGMTHNNTATYPRLADVLGYVRAEDAIKVGEAVVTTQRDYGDRSNRKHARMKYTVDDKGVDWFRSQVEARSGATLHPARPFSFDSNGDAYGWAPSGDGAWSYTLFVENGRIKDREGYRLKSGLQAIGKLLAAEPGGRGEFRFTPNQNVAVGRISAALKPAVQALLEEHGILNGAHSGLRLNAMACVALPTCALALAESERYLPSLITRLEVALEEVGLRDDAITMRMTGCPNGCARPYVAEIAFVGRSPGVYNLYLGAGFHGERLNKLYREGVDEEAIVAALTPLFKRYASERLSKAEHFGDFVVRAGVIKATTAGKNFHEQ